MTVPFLDLGAAVEELQPALGETIQRVTASGRFVLGPELEAFEREFADYCEVAHCIGVGNGLDALSILLRAYDVGKGDDVLVPAHTFIATWLAVSATGARPVPVAVLETTGNLDPDGLAQALTPRTRAVMPVHLYGQPADMDRVGEFARRHELLVFEDAAQAHGARWRGQRVGGLGDGAGFSFYPGKNLGALGDGGAITCNRDDVAARCRRLRNYGSPRRYVHDEGGVNSRLDELQAAILRIRLPLLDAWNERRRSLAAKYHARLEGVRTPTVADGAESVWHLFVIRCAERGALQTALDRAGIQTLVHYPTAPHETGAYRELPIRAEAASTAVSLARSVLSLPIGPHLPFEDVDRVITVVQDFARSRM